MVNSSDDLSLVSCMAMKSGSVWCRYLVSFTFFAAIPSTFHFKIRILSGPRAPPGRPPLRASSGRFLWTCGVKPDPGLADYLEVSIVPVAGGPLAAQMLFQAGSRRSVADRHSVLWQVGRQPGQLVRRLVAGDTSMAWHPLQVHPVVPSDPLQTGPDLVRESLRLLSRAITETSQRGLRVCADANVHRGARCRVGAFQIFVRLV